MGCFNCDKRHVGCHAECEEFKEYQVKIQKRRKKKAEERAYTGYMIDRAFEHDKAVYRHERGGGNK